LACRVAAPVSPDRMRENFAIFDFELTAVDMAAITGLERGADPKTMDWIPP
jgi:2,5-diketo-D-gluconate reductase A